MKNGLTSSYAKDRSYEKIEPEDLKKLSALARDDLRFFFEKYRRYKPYVERLIVIALCQGAAQHYVDGKTGVKDFDIWSFFAEIPGTVLPYRRHKQIDSTLMKFGVSEYDIWKGYTSRHVDLFLRAVRSDIAKTNIDSPKDCINEYLKTVRNKSTKELASKAIVGLHPKQILGQVLHRGNNTKKVLV